MSRLGRKNSGFSLLELMVTVSILGVIVILLSSSISQKQLTANSINQRLEIETLRQFIRLRLDCKQTINSVMKNSKYNLFDKSGKNLFKVTNYSRAQQANYYEFGDLSLYFDKYEFDGNKIAIKYPLDQRSWSSLYNEMPFVCEN